MVAAQLLQRGQVDLRQGNPLFFRRLNLGQHAAAVGGQLRGRKDPRPACKFKSQQLSHQGAFDPVDGAFLDPRPDPPQGQPVIVGLGIGDGDDHDLRTLQLEDAEGLEVARIHAHRGGDPARRGLKEIELRAGGDPPLRLDRHQVHLVLRPDQLPAGPVKEGAVDHFIPVGQQEAAGHQVEAVGGGKRGVECIQKGGHHRAGISDHVGDADLRSAGAGGRRLRLFVRDRLPHLLHPGEHPQK